MRRKHLLRTALLGLLLLLLSTGGYLWVTRGDSWAHEEWRRKKVGSDLADSSQFRSIYGNGCIVKSTGSSGVGISKYGMVFYSSQYNVVGPDFSEIIQVQWISNLYGIRAAVLGFSGPATGNESIEVNPAFELPTSEPNKPAMDKPDTAAS